MTEHVDATANEETAVEAAEALSAEVGGEAQLDEQAAEAAVETAAGVMEAEVEDVVAEPEAIVEVVAEAEEAVAEPEAVVEVVAETEEAAEAGEDDDAKRVVRMLAVGQQVDGVVKRVTDFGAFVDIGVGRDGLIHISELSLQRVGKVGDVLSANQAIQPWIKKLDRKRNRISLTLIDPEMKTIRDLQEGEIVNGTVTRILPYGAFIDIGIGRDALLHVREMSNKFVEKPEDVVKVGEAVEVRIIEVSRRRGRVDLSMKGLRDEPEEEPEVVAEVTVNEEIEEAEDEFADVEVLSPMELAFKRAVEAEGAEIQVSKKSGKRGRKGDYRAIQDEIIARTLDTARK